MADQTFNPNLNFYQSANADAETIKNDFIIRLHEYDIIMDDIRRNPMKDSVQHYLLLGRRGSGKSTLLKRIQIEIEADNELKQKYIAVNLAEEQANIYRLFDLWEAVREELEHKKIQVAEPEWNDDSNIYSRNIFETIHEAIAQSGKKIILLLDNIDRIFENLKDDAALLREILLNYDDIKIIGGSTRMTEHFWRYDQPFYEFFRVMKLEPLTSEEIKKLFLHWADKYNLPILKDFVEKRTGQLEAVRILTDGLPRTLLLFVNILVNKENGTGYEYMKLIMDRVTPLYQERLNNLPPAQRKVILQLAFLWEGVGAREVADAARMDIKTVSAQLSQLADNGIVDKISTNNKNNLYRLSERFFNLWLIFTQGSPREKRRAKYLTIFLEGFYDAEDLVNLAENHLKCLQDMSPGKAVLLTKAFAQSKYISSETRDMLINRTQELNINDDLRAQLPSSTKKIIEEVTELINKKQINRAIILANDIEQEDGFKDSVFAWIYDKSGNYNEAEKYNLSAIEKGNIKANFNLALLYENHFKKYDLAEKYYLLAIKYGETDSLNNLAVLYYKNKKYKLAEEYFLLASDKGDDKAMNSLAVLYVEDRKFDIAEKYLLLATERGNANAGHNLASLYFTQNKIELAKKYYSIAIEKGESAAMFDFAIICEREKEQEQAEKYYLMAVHRGFPQAMFNLAALYYNKQKFELSEKYYLMAIDNGIGDAMNNLAALYYHQNKIELAEKYYLLDIENRNAMGKNAHAALFNLALLYYRSAINKAKALFFISQAYLLKNDANTRSLYLTICVWNGETAEISKELPIDFKNRDYSFADTILINLLVHHQVNLVNQLFSNSEFGQVLKEMYAPIYYAAILLLGKEVNTSLKIPPEVEETVNGLLKAIKERQEFYYKA